jgi:hypothetical protein
MLKKLTYFVTHLQLPHIGLLMLGTTPVLYNCLYLCIYGSTALCWALIAFSVSWSFYTVGRTPWMRDQLVARPPPTHRATQTQNKNTQTSMPWVGFEPTIPAFVRAKTFHALDCAATAMGNCLHISVINFRHNFTLCLFQHVCEASLSLTEQHRLKVFQNKLLKNVGWRQMEVCRKNGHETSVTIKRWEFIYQVKDYYHV